MTNLSSLSKCYTLSITAFACIATAQVLEHLEANFMVELGFDALAVLFMGLSIYYAMRTKKLINKMRDVFKECRRGDMESRIILAKEKSELKELVDSANDFIDMADAYVRESKTALDYAAHGKFYRKVVKTGLQGSFIQAVDLVNNGINVMEEKTQALFKMADDLDTNVGGIVSSVDAAATELSQTTEIVVAQVATTRDKSSAVANASEQTALNVQSVASASEEMSASVKEIARQMQNVNLAIDESAKKASDAEKQAVSLQHASQSIGEIANLIENIAEQINLLALNATIESARAGEAGKGFAVVAGEVKNLANQTAKATEEINKEIENAQQVANDVIVALSAIGVSINSVTESSSAVASAVEEQTAVTNEISSNMQTASSGVNEMKDNISEIASSIDQVDSASHQTQEAAHMLSEQSESLNTAVQNFLSGIRKSA